MGTLPPEDLLETLYIKFVASAPDDSLNNVPYLMFLVEQAHWHYEDVVRLSNLELKHYAKLDDFVRMFFHRVPDLTPYAHKVESYLQQFREYKGQIPVCGGILLDSTLEQVLLVKTPKGNTWTFPKGKINSGEPMIKCAAREVKEETGYDAQMNEEDYLEINLDGKKNRLYIVPNVDTSFNFYPDNPHPLVCQPIEVLLLNDDPEVASYAWYKIKELPSSKAAQHEIEIRHHKLKFFGVWQFTKPLTKWISQYRRKMKLSTPQGSFQGSLAELQASIGPLRPPYVPPPNANTARANGVSTATERFPGTQGACVSTSAHNARPAVPSAPLAGKPAVASGPDVPPGLRPPSPPQNSQQALAASTSALLPAGSTHAANLDGLASVGKHIPGLPETPPHAGRGFSGFSGSVAFTSSSATTEHVIARLFASANITTTTATVTTTATLGDIVTASHMADVQSPGSSIPAASPVLAQRGHPAAVQRATAALPIKLTGTAADVVARTETQTIEASTFAMADHSALSYGQLVVGSGAAVVHGHIDGAVRYKEHSQQQPWKASLQDFTFDTAAILQCL